VEFLADTSSETLFRPFTIEYMTMNFDKLLKQPNALPSAPKVVRKLIDTFNQEEVDLMYAASLIEDDPVLTAKLLKMANSAFFGLTRNVSNARDAINVMGLIKVRALVIGASLSEGFHCVASVNLNQFWRAHDACGHARSHARPGSQQSHARP
jgi:HD-like signal output (HDOD) protein